MCFKKHVEKVHGIEQSYKRVKAQVAIRVILKKWTKTHICWIYDKSFSNKCVLKNMLKKFMRLDQPHKSIKAQVAIRVVLKKSESITTQW